MGQFMILLHKIVGFKLLAIVLSVTTVVVVFQVSTAYKAYALNVHIEVKPTPSGVVKVIDRSFVPPSGLVNSEDNHLPFLIPEGGGEPPPDGEGEPPPDGEGGAPPEGEGESFFQTINQILPPGIAKLIQRGGGAPPGIVKLAGEDGSAIYLNTDIPFGDVFPGENITSHFVVCLSGVENSGPPSTPWPWGQGNYEYVCYKITVRTRAGSSMIDLSDYITVRKDSLNESDTEYDETATAPGDKEAWGTLNATTPDTTDKWFVTLDGAPTGIGDYECEIEVRVCHTDSSSTCPGACLP